MAIRVLLADDQAMVRAGFSALLSSEDGLEVCGEAGDGERAVALARELRPDVVLMDVRMPRMDGIEATRALAGPGVEDPVDVLVLTTFDLDEYVYGALQAGAAGFLLKDAQPDALIEAIRLVGHGHGLIAPEVTRRLIARFAELSPRRPAAAGLGTLSRREQEVLALVAQGNSNAQIGVTLRLGETTIKSHVSAVLSKLDVHSRVQAVILAYETGLVTPSGASPPTRYGSSAPARGRR